MKERTLNPITVMKINLMQVKNLNISLETIKLLEENMEKKLLGPDLSYDFFFFIYTTKAQATEAKQTMKTTTS